MDADALDLNSSMLFFSNSSFFSFFFKFRDAVDARFVKSVFIS